MLADLIVNGFNTSTVARINHLTETSSARHVALAEFYDGLPILLDKLAETLIGGKEKLAFENLPFRIKPSEKSIEEFILYVQEDYLKTPQYARPILDEIIVLANRTLYKLENLK